MARQHLRSFETGIWLRVRFVAFLVVFSWAVVGQSEAFEIRKIPLAGMVAQEKILERFKSLPAEEQQQLLQEYQKRQGIDKVKDEEAEALEIREEKKEDITKKEMAKVPIEEGLSAFERFVAGKLPADISVDVRQFGYDLFKAPPSTFAPSRTAPVTLDYVIGPGDEMKINLWGKVEKEIKAIVDRQGNITLPSVGVVNVAGLTFKELKTYLKRKFSRYFSGFQINVTLSSLRTIKIFVVGKARTPGSYDISGLSTMINALFASGGPSKIGSMRRIQLTRAGGTITKLDLYDFILRGDKSKDVVLQPNDVIFVPTVGALVAVVGNVRAPAIFELKGETRIIDALDMAGGVMATGHLDRVQVERIVDNKFMAIIDKNLSDIKGEDNVVLKDGDIVKVFPISGAIVNAVNLRGNVSRPGMYEWHKGLKIGDIIRRKDLLPGTLYDFAKIERLTPLHNEIRLVHFDLDKALSGNSKEDIILEPYDTITIYNQWDFKERPVVRIAGAVNMPDEYEYKTDMKISDLMKLAGGLKKYAHNKAELTRVIVTQDGPVTERMTISIAKDKDGMLKDDLPLQEDDYLLVRTVPDWHLYHQVSITGEVLFPGAYTIKKGECLADLIERAGGFTDEAYLKGTVFTRKSTQEAQQRMLEQALDRLEQQVLSAASSKTAAAFSEEESKILEAETRQYQELIKRLRQAKAIGRLVIRMAPLSVMRQTPANVELEDGDKIFIPAKTSTINVMGSVYNPSTYLYDAETKVDAYVEMAGGPSQNAEPDKIYVIKVDGSALSPKKVKGGLFEWNTKTYRWEVGGLSKTKLDPGDTIIVPEKLDRLALMRNIKDISQVIFQMAVTAGVVVALF